MTRRRPPSGPMSDPGDDRDEEPEEKSVDGHLCRGVKFRPYEMVLCSLCLDMPQPARDAMEPDRVREIEARNIAAAIAEHCPIPELGRWRHARGCQWEPPVAGAVPQAFDNLVARLTSVVDTAISGLLDEHARLREALEQVDALLTQEWSNKPPSEVAPHTYSGQAQQIVRAALAPRPATRERE